MRSVTRNILKGLKVVAASKLSSIINLSYRDEVPTRAEDVLNELIKYYDRAAIDEKNSLAKNTLAFVEERLNAVGVDIDSMNKIVTRYKSSQGASDISTQGQLFLPKRQQQRSASGRDQHAVGCHRSGGKRPYRVVRDLHPRSTSVHPTRHCRT